ncbi:MAG: DUF4097 family beta strand repeat-containing protein [Nitrososphaerota archaeon]
MSVPPSPTNLPSEDRARISTPDMPPGEPPMYAPPPAPPVAPGPPSPRRNNTALIIAVVAAVVLAPLLLCGIGAALFAGTSIFMSARQVEQSATSRFQLAVPSQPAITISDTAGRVTITKGAAQQVTVEATKHTRATSNESARDQLDAMTVTAVSTADGARITATNEQNRPLNQQTIDLRVTVPETSDLTLTIEAGTISMTSITGRLNLTSSAGTVELRDMTLQGATSLRLSAGTLNFSGMLASDAAVTANIATGTANIRLPATSATHFDASTQVGSVHVTGWTTTVQQAGAGQSTAFDLNAQPTSKMTVRVNVGTINLSTR